MRQKELLQETINLVIPYYGYSRQERKAAPREPISAKLVADLFSAAGANRAFAIDLHAPAIQGFFNGASSMLAIFSAVVARPASGYTMIGLCRFFFLMQSLIILDGRFLYSIVLKNKAIELHSLADIA